MNLTSAPIRNLALAALMLSLGGCSLRQLAIDDIGTAIAGSGAALPVAGVPAVGMLLVTFVPWLATGLPRLMRGPA